MDWFFHKIPPKSQATSKVFHRPTASWSIDHIMGAKVHRLDYSQADFVIGDTRGKNETYVEKEATTSSATKKPHFLDNNEEA